MALEDGLKLLQGTFIVKFKLIESELDLVKAQLQHHRHSVTYEMIKIHIIQTLSFLII